MFVFESYEAGKVYGSDRFRITREMIRGWLALYEVPTDTDSMPSGLIILMQQQAYKKIITPRPPGHIQGRQRFQVRSRPRADSVVITDVSCVSKEIRKDRLWVEMGFLGRTTDGTEVYSGINTVLVPC